VASTPTANESFLPDSETGARVALQRPRHYPAPVNRETAVGNRERALAALERLRWVAKIEGVSFLVLLGIAMPLKYAAGLPMAVKLVGWAHGVLFVLFLISLGYAWRKAKLPLGLSALVFISALLPFGPFVIDGRLARFLPGERALP
jgi:integral membrane protein